MIVARQSRDRREAPLQVRRIPLFRKNRDILRLHELVLKTLGKHPRLAPAPHFLTRLVANDELMRLPSGEAKLDHSRCIVPYIELELDAAARMHGKGGAELGLRLCARG